MQNNHHKPETSARPASVQLPSGAQSGVTSGTNQRVQAGQTKSEVVRLCAYQKWEAAGKPNGDGVNFWLAAEQELLKAR